MRHLVYVYREKQHLGHPESRTLVLKAVNAALREENVAQACSVGVTFTDDEGIHAVNLENRGIDAPTDVLSFPINEPDYDNNTLYLGDMVLSLERAERQGEEYGGGYGHELQYLAVHSVLHMLGYDHLDEGPQKAAMREREKIIMKRLGYEF